MLDFLDQTLLRLGIPPALRLTVRSLLLAALLLLAVWGLGYAPGRFKYLNW